MIKSDPDLCHIPVVVLTTSSAEEDILRSYKLHANAYVTKPVDLDQFTSAVTDGVLSLRDVATHPASDPRRSASHGDTFATGRSDDHRRRRGGLETDRNGYPPGMTACAGRASKVSVVIPARDEATLLPACLRATLTAAACLPVPIRTLVVLYACDDTSADLAGQFSSDVEFVRVDAGNVGAARAVGFGREHLRPLSRSVLAPGVAERA